MRVHKEMDAEDIRPGLPGLLVRRRGVKGQDPVRVRSRERRPDLALIVFQIRGIEDDKRRGLLPVEAVELRFLVMDPLRVGFAGRYRQHIPVHRHMMMDAQLAHELGSRKLPEILHPRGLVFFLRFPAGLVSFVQKAKGMRGGGRGDRRALAHRPAKQPLRQRGRAERRHAGRTRGLPRQRHIGRVAPEGRNVLLYPLKRQNLIQKPVIPGGALFLKKLLIRKEAEDPQPVPQVDDDHAVPRKARAVKIGVPGLAGLQRTAVDVHQHRKLAGLPGRLPDVEVKGVLADRRPVIIVRRNLKVVIADQAF